MISTRNKSASTSDLAFLAFSLPDEAAVAHILKIDRWNWHWPEPRFNVAPTTRVPMVSRAEDALLELNGARWGLIPHW